MVYMRKLEMNLLPWLLTRGTTRLTRAGLLFDTQYEMSKIKNDSEPGPGML